MNIVKNKIIYYVYVYIDVYIFFDYLIIQVRNRF